MSLDILPSAERRTFYEELAQKGNPIIPFLATSVWENRKKFTYKGSIEPTKDTLTIRRQIIRDALELRKRGEPFRIPYGDDDGRINILADHLRDVAARRAATDPQEIAVIEARMTGRSSVLSHLRINDDPVHEALFVLQEVVDQLAPTGSLMQTRK